MTDALERDINGRHDEKTNPIHMSTEFTLDEGAKNCILLSINADIRLIKDE